MWFGKGTVTLYKEQKRQGSVAVDNSLLPRFGPLCSIKPYSCFGGLIWRCTKACELKPGKAALG